MSAVILAAAAALFMGIASCGDSPEASRVVATVNGKPITHGELLRELEKRHGATALMDLVDGAVIRQEAEKRGIKLSARESEFGMERAAARAGSMTDLKLKLQRNGIPVAAYQQKIETEMLLDKIVAAEVKVSEADARAYYEAHKQEFSKGERVRARMILLFGDRSNAEAVRDALKDPAADFAGLAKSLSEDDATRDNGGDMGYFEQDNYATEITSVAFALSPGELSDIIKAPDGWVILKVEARQPAGPLAFDEVKDQIHQRLAREQQDETRGKWLVQARQAAKLRVSDRDLKDQLKARMTVEPMLSMPGDL